MSVLAAQTIRKMAKAGMIVPFRERTKYDNLLSGGLSPAAYDCHSGTELRLEPGQSGLVVTQECFMMPNFLQAEIKDKSTWARRFVSVYNTVVDPGFRGWLTIEVTNNSSEPWVIEEGDPICKLVFYRLDSDTDEPYTGKYQDQPPEPVGPR